MKHKTEGRACARARQADNCEGGGEHMNHVPGCMRLAGWASYMVTVFAVLGVWMGTGWAIEVNLDVAAAQKAIEEGKKMDMKTVPTRFGADLTKDICGGGGEIRTKSVTLNRLGGVIAANPEKAEQDKAKIDENIAKILDSKVLKIAFDFCGDTQDFAEDSQATLEQDGKQIKGEMAKPDKAKKNAEGPAFRGKVAASFPYGAFDPNKMTKITLYPKVGDAMSWDVDFSKIK